MIGKVVSHYKILQKLGEGGTGVVYKALDEKLNRIVALKFFHDQLFTNKAQKAFLTREAQAAAALNHPNIRTIYEIDETDECFYMSMAFIEGDEEKWRSIYGADGLIDQSKRLERFLLWPSGIKSPGTMRGWGHHATAFVGKRHFDDPFLLEEAFEQ